MKEVVSNLKDVLFGNRIQIVKTSLLSWSERPSRFRWGFPAIDLWSYTLSGLEELDVVQEYGKKMKHYFYPKDEMLPTQTVYLEGVSVRVPREIGSVIDRDYPGWRKTCAASPYDYRIERRRNTTDQKLVFPCADLALLRPNWPFCLIHTCGVQNEPASYPPGYYARSQIIIFQIISLRDFVDVNPNRHWAILVSAIEGARTGGSQVFKATGSQAHNFIRRATAE